MNSHRTAGASQQRLRIYSFGTPRIELDGEAFTPKTRAALALLLYLSIERDSHQRGWISEFLWGETSTESARVLLRNALYNLRKTCGGDCFQADRDVIGIAPSATVWVDVVEFSERLGRSSFRERRSGSTILNKADDTQITEIAEIVKLYRAPFLSGFSLSSSTEFDSWIIGRRGEYKTRVDLAYTRLIELLRSRGSIAEAIEHAEGWLGLDRVNEMAYRTLMSLHMAEGNRSAAISQYERCAESLRRMQEAEPSPETIALYHEIQDRTSLVKPALAHVAGSLPNRATKIIGRTAEIRAIEAEMVRSRIVTVAGAGGSGKTTISIEVGHEVASLYPDGVWFAGLATVSDPELVAGCVAECFGLHIRQEHPKPASVVNFVGQQRLLLIMDNCEHVIDASADLVHDLIESCPNVSILVTSREPLGVSGEMVYRLPCLAYPESTSASPMSLEDLKTFAAVQLFLERAHRVSPEFDMSERNATLVTEICAAVDGLPLALEMAASLVEALELKDIFRRSADDLDILPATVRGKGARHRNLTAVVAWSHRLLSPDEQVLFRRLSVFRRGWTVEAAQALCREDYPGIDVLGILAHLVRKSLVQPQDSGRYRMLEPVRQFAAQRLKHEDDFDLVLQRHCTWCRDFVEKTSRGFYDSRQADSFTCIDDEYANIRKALDFATERRNSACILSFGSSLYWYWFIRGLAHEGFGYLSGGIDALCMPRNALEARGLGAAAYLSWWIDRRDIGTQYAQATLTWAESEGDCELRAFTYLTAALAETPAKSASVLAHVEQYCEESLRLYRSIDHKWGIVQNLLHTAVLQLHSNRPTEHRDYEFAIERLEEASRIAHDIDDQIDVGKINYWLAMAEFQTRNLKRAGTHLQENIFTDRDRRAFVDVALSMGSFAIIELEENRPESALEMLHESLNLIRRIDSNANTVLTIQNIAHVLSKTGEYETSISLYTFVLHDRRKRGAGTRQCERMLAHLECLVETSVFETCVSSGKKMDLADAIELAKAT